MGRDRGGDGHGVQGQSQQLVEGTRLAQDVAEVATDRLQPRGVRVAEGDDFGLGTAREVADQVRAPVAATHDSDTYLVHQG